MNYSWRNISFDAPSSRDDSTILLVDSAEPPSFNLTLRIDPLSGGDKAFSAYVAAQKPAAGVTLDHKSERVIAGRPAVVLESHLEAETEVLRQQQALVADGDNVLVVTMTARAGAAVQARAAFDRALSSLAWR